MKLYANSLIVHVFLVNGSHLLLTSMYVSPVTQFAENPRAASDDYAKARIDDMLTNVSSLLLNVTHSPLSHIGRYSYAVSMRPRSSSAVAALFAIIMIFFSRKNVASQSA